jgi:hypothetical protein
MPDHQEGIWNARRSYESREDQIPLSLIKESRGSRIDLHCDCTRCGVYTSPLWYYARSSHGCVYLCVRCRERLLEQRRIRRGQQIKRDVLWRALPGSFEGGSRRR